MGFQLISNSFPTRFQLYFQLEYRNSQRHPRQSYRSLMGYDYCLCGLCEILRRFWKSHPIKIFPDGFPADFQLISNSFLTPGFDLGTSWKIIWKLGGANRAMFDHQLIVGAHKLLIGLRGQQ